MNTPRLHRFDFGSLRDFRGPIVQQTVAAAKEEEIVVAPTPPPTFSEQELEEARLAGKKQGYNEGFAAGQMDAHKAAERRMEDSNRVLLSLSEQLVDLEQRYHEILRNESQYLSQLVLSISRKVAGDAIKSNAEQTINAILARCMPVIFSKPRLNMELHPDISEATIERIENDLRTKGYEGKIQFKTNPALGLSDVNLDWGNGQMQYSVANLWTEVEMLIERVPLELTFAETLNNAQNTSTGE